MFTVAILTASDRGSRGEREDKSGQVIREIISHHDGSVVEYAVVPDDEDTIAEQLEKWCDSGKIDIIPTTGGTGLSPRDNTPDATMQVIDKAVPGLAEAMRAESLKKTPHAMLSRAVAGVRRKTLIVNMPGSPKAVRECLEVILPALPHAVEVLKGLTHIIQERSGDPMQTMDYALKKLVEQRVITVEEALSESSDAQELMRLLGHGHARTFNP